MAWRVVDAKHAFDHAVAEGATPYEGDDKALDVPRSSASAARCSISSIHTARRVSAYDAEFEWLGARDPRPLGVGFYFLDHLTHNVYRGQMDKWWDFYRNLFGFKRSISSTLTARSLALVSRRHHLALPARSAFHSTNPRTRPARSPSI